MATAGLKRGVDLLDEKVGAGRAAERGDTVVFGMRLFLHRGDEVRLNEEQITRMPRLPSRVVDGRRLVDHVVRLGRREAIAAVEMALVGMKTGGYRRVRAAPHLTYRDKGIPGLVPPNALLIIDLWLHEIRPSQPPQEEGVVE